jgi:hypothetical protein
MVKRRIEIYNSKRLKPEKEANNQKNAILGVAFFFTRIMKIIDDSKLS